MAYEDVRYEVDGPNAIITIDREKRMNSFRGKTIEELISAFKRAWAAPEVRAVIFTGAGDRAFCTGGDVKQRAETGDYGPTENGLFEALYLQRLIREIPKPVIAAVNGIAAGAGASVSFACDFRIAADSAKFLLAFANVGLALDTGASWTLPRLIGHARATALAILAEPVGASAALEMGLVNAVVPGDELETAAFELAARLAAGPTAAYAAIKEQLLYSAAHPLPSALEREGELQNALGSSPDHREATAAFLRKEKPVFHGR
jgi:2-(1,2-epoxy-1,2-dihydrophenyl)acetyl-CoA isomerase